MNDVKNIHIPTVLSLVLAAAGCASEAAVPQAPQAVQTRQLKVKSTVHGGQPRYSAVVEPDSDVPLSFRIPGYIAALMQVRGEDGRMRDLAEGDRVRKGTVLVRIRPAEYEDRVRQAKAQAAAAEALATKARLDFDRATRLYGTDSMTKPDFDAAQAQHDATQSELRAAVAQSSEAELALADTSIVAPFDADIVKKTVELGSFAGPGLPLLTLSRTDLMKIVIGVPDTTVRSIKLGQPVEVTVDAFHDRTFQARISRMASAADPRTRNFEVEVGIPNRDHMLKAGMIGSLQLAMAESNRQPAAVTVPLSSIVQADQGRYGVFVVAASSAGPVATLRPIEIGTVVGTEISVVSGLGQDDEVITTGANLLKDGQPVEVIR
jgi:multidrug efflux system membrane fusion protein